MSENPITFTAETELRGRFGLTAKVLAGIRFHNLTEGIDWKKEGREICYTPEGAERLQTLLALAPEDGPPVEAVPVTADLELVKVRLMNPRIVLAKKSGADPEAGVLAHVRVRVKDARNLRPRMVLKACVAVDEGAGLWEFRGRLPRFPGKW